MKITKEQILDKVFLLTFENQKEITSTFLRFQEHYESPKFRNKIFTLEEFKKWYSDLKGGFSYYTDWNGFNIPSYILKPFYDGKFDPLSEKEKQLLKLFKNENGKFYIIGIHKDTKSVVNLLKHEMAHGLFYTNDEYRKNVQNILAQYDLKKIKNELREKGGYHEEVLDDEVHAYSLDSVNKLKSHIPAKMKKSLQDEYQKVLTRKNMVD